VFGSLRCDSGSLRSGSEVCVVVLEFVKCFGSLCRHSGVCVAVR